ncbi:MAG: DUF3500 domain-containing protein, partial [Hymenobacter sp.]
MPRGAHPCLPGRGADESPGGPRPHLPAHGAGAGCLRRAAEQPQRRPANPGAADYFLRRCAAGAGPGRAVSGHPARRAAGALSAAQRQLAIQAIKLYVNDLEPAAATSVLAKYAAELPTTYLAYTGSKTMGQAHDYVRPHSAALRAQPFATTVHGLLSTLLDAYRTETGDWRFTVSGPDGPLGARAATALALIIHEHATNAMKYGALSNEEGRIHIET